MDRDYRVSEDLDRGQAIGQSEYYQRIQRQLKERQQSQDSQNRQERLELPNDTLADESVQAAVQAVEADSPVLDTRDKVTIHSLKSLRWRREGDEEVPELSPVGVPNTHVDLMNDGTRILRFMGIKIDFTSRFPALKESFMRSVVQSRSHKVFLRHYAAIKVGVLGRLFSMMGLSVNEIDHLKTEALKDAVKENIRLMAENVRNRVLTELVHGQSKKAKRALRIYREFERQLSIQIGYLGKGQYWNKERMLEEEIRQMTQMFEEFQRERDTLQYQLDFMTSAVVAAPRSRVSARLGESVRAERAL